MPDVERKEDEALKLGQAVVTQFEIKYDGALGLESGHGSGDVSVVGGLA